MATPKPECPQFAINIFFYILEDIRAYVVAGG